MRERVYTSTKPVQCEALRRHIHGSLRPMDYPKPSFIQRILGIAR